MFRLPCATLISIRLRALLSSLFVILAFAVTACGGGSTQSATTPTATAIPTVALDAQLGQKTVYVASTGATVSSAGSVFALNAQTGKVKWKYATGGMYGTPVLADGAIYVAPESDEVIALDAATGAKRWTYTRPDGSRSTGFDGYVAVAGSTVFVACDAGSVYALNTADGKLLWQFKPLAPADHIYAPPAVANGLVYDSSAGSSNAFYALDATTGAVRWKASAPGGFDGRPLATADAVYVGANDHNLYALDAKTGVVRWRFLTNDIAWSRPANGNGVVYVGSRDQNVYALNTADGKLLWKVQTMGTAPTPPIPTGAAPTLVGDTLYVGAQGGAVYALKAADGAQIWRHDLGAAVDNAPTVTDGAVFVTTQPGAVYALRASDGALGWTYTVDGYAEGVPIVGP
jgi:outer membrane protein assembly factor BamB